MNVSDSPRHLWALHTLTSPSLDPENPLFRHYPAMKLGVRESVKYYAQLLVPIAEKILASEPEPTDWVVTAPPLYVIPAGANLIAWEVNRILRMRASHGVSLRSVDLRYSLPNPQSSSNAPGGRDYSNSGVSDRIRNRQRLHEGKWAPQPDPADFQGRAVLFINDINVTGTQQHYVQGTLDRVHPASIHWLYVIQVEAALGRSNPEIEYALNHLNLATFEDFVEIVTKASIDYTSRCVSRLMSCSAGQLETLARLLDATRRERLLDLVAQEGSYTDEASLVKRARLQGS